MVGDYISTSFMHQRRGALLRRGKSAHRRVVRRSDCHGPRGLQVVGHEDLKLEGKAGARSGSRRRRPRGKNSPEEGKPKPAPGRFDRDARSLLLLEAGPEPDLGSRHIKPCNAPLSATAYLRVLRPGRPRDSGGLGSDGAEPVLHDRRDQPDPAWPPATTHSPWPADAGVAAPAHHGVARAPGSPTCGPRRWCGSRHRTPLST